MENIVLDVDAIREQATVIVQGIMAGENLDLVISGAMLLAIVVLSLASIWRTRTRTRAATPPATPSSASGFTRWLTPMGMKSIPAEQGVPARPRRKSGSNRAIRVVTPVSKVPQRALKAGANAMEIARKSGLSRDGVAMMMAAAAPKSQSAKPSAAKLAAQAVAPTRTVATGATAGAMVAPGPYTQAQRVIPAKVERPGVGTRFSARVS